jgi:DNA-binding IclR family transcriptional regulator
VAEGSAPEYGAPALDKGLDIIELLADESGGLTQGQIADATGRTVSQIFRVLTTLERRGYLHRDRQSGLYGLSLRLFDLAHRQEPLRGLVQAALTPMRALAIAAGQSCNLSIDDADRVRVVAQVEGPGDFGFRVRVGALFPLETTATGLVLLAFRGPVAGRPPSSSRGQDEERDRTLRQAQGTGFVERPDPLQPGVTDVVFPVLRADGSAHAALTVPYVSTSLSALGVSEVRRLAADAASEIAAGLNPVSTP